MDDVLAEIDRTRTALGCQSLYRRIRLGSRWVDSPQLEELAIRFGTDSGLRERVGMTLAGQGRFLGKGLWLMTRPDVIQIRWWYRVFPILTIGMILSLASTVFEPALILVAFVLACVNLGIRGLTQWQVPGILAPMGQMAPLLGTADRLSRMPELEASRPIDLMGSLARLKPLRRIAAWVTRGSDPSEVSSMAEWINLIFLLDANALFFGARYIRSEAAVLKEIAEWVGDVDLALGIASLRAEPRCWCIPGWEEGAHATAEGVWHPLIESAVANDVELTPGAGLVITGANASGKTTYIRSVGVAAVMAVALNTCPATSWRGGPFRVMSMIGGGDDLLGGRSYYEVEVERIIELLNAAESPVPTLFLIDELLRGTNTIDRLAAGEAILRKLVRIGDRPRHAAMIATHDLELTVLLKDSFEPWHFREAMTADGPTFEYRRQPGPATSRTALALLEAAGADEGVMRAARARARALTEQSLSRVMSVEVDAPV